MSRLTALSVASTKLAPGRHGDGDGLYLLVKPTGARSWLLRIQADGRRRDIGLGSYIAKEVPEAAHLPLLQRRMLTLAEARQKANILRLVTKSGRDPVIERDRREVGPMTFMDAANAVHAAKREGWAAKTADSFLSTMKDYAYPSLGRLLVAEIDAQDIAGALRPIWLSKPAIAAKVRHRIGLVLSFAKAHRWRTSDAPGKEVPLLLAEQREGGRMASMPYSDVPAFVQSMEDKSETVGRLALMFLIATAARSGEVRHAKWSEVDRDQKLWKRPADVMKNNKAHSVTLNAFALSVLDRARALNPVGDLIFPAPSGKPLSDMSISAVMRQADVPFVPHGFRSSFRDFSAERMSEIPDPVAEAALAHVVPDKVERAYKRTEFLEMRRKLLDAWGAFASAESPIIGAVG